MIKNKVEYEEWKKTTKEGITECECEECHRVFTVRKAYGKNSQSSNHYYRLNKLDKLICPWCFSTANFKKTQSSKSKEQRDREQQMKVAARKQTLESQIELDKDRVYTDIESLKKAFTVGIKAATVICEKCHKPIVLENRDHVRRFIKCHPEIILCKSCNISTALTKSNLEKKKEPTYNKTSEEEKDFVSYIKEIYSGTVVENTKDIIPPYELDVYLPEIPLAIEYDGIYWHVGKPKYYHQDKTILCEKKGIKLLRIFSCEWKEHRQEIEQLLKDNINRNFDNPPKRVLDRRFWSRLDFPGYHIQFASEPSVVFTNGTSYRVIETGKYEKPVYDSGVIVLGEGEGEDYKSPRELFLEFRDKPCPNIDFKSYWEFTQINYDVFLEMLNEIEKPTNENIISYFYKKINKKPAAPVEIDNEVIGNSWNTFKTWDFPYQHFTNEELKKEWRHLIETDGSNNSSVSSKIIRQFHPSLYSYHLKGKMSPVQYWDYLKKDYGAYQKLYNNRMKYATTHLADLMREDGLMRAETVREGLSIMKAAPCVSYFKPGLAKYLVNKYLSEYNTVFDPFSGFSGRMLGVCSLGKKYIGQDINSTIVEESNNIISYFNLNASVIEKDIFESKGEYDCLFTCPPYNNKEIWEDNLTDKSCDDWIDECLKRFECRRYLFVVDNTDKYKDCIVEEISNRSHLGNNKEYVIDYILK